MERLNCRTFDRASFRHYLAWLTPIAQNVRKPDRLVEMLLEELRGRRLLIPTRRTLELLVHQAQSRAELVIYTALTNGLTDTQRKTLDSLLDQKPEASTSWMAWLRQPPQAPAARNILALIERLRFVRQLGIDSDRQRGIPVSAFERLAADCLRATVQHAENWPFHVDAPCWSQPPSGWKPYRESFREVIIVRPDSDRRKRHASARWVDRMARIFRHLVEPLGRDICSVRPGECSSLQGKLLEVRQFGQRSENRPLPEVG
jgi:hypothetical protein